MPRPSKEAQFGEGQEFFLNLYADVAFDLQIYCDVLGTQKTKLINRAVRELIRRDLDENKGFSNRFEELKAQRIDEARRQRQAGPLRVIRKPATAKSRTRRQRRDR